MLACHREPPGPPIDRRPIHPRSEAPTPAQRRPEPLTPMFDAEPPDAFQTNDWTAA